MSQAKTTQLIEQVLQFPITLSLTGLACLLALLSPFLPVLEWFCFDYTALTRDEELWRFISGHFVHSSLSHAFWDITLFCLLSAYLEKNNPERLCLGLSFSIIGLSLFLLMPVVEVMRYSGLSGVIYCLLILAYWEWQKNHNPLLGLIPALMVIGKTLFEWQADEPMFVTEGWSLFAEAHLIGSLIGITALIYFRASSRSAAV